MVVVESAGAIALALMFFFARRVLCRQVRILFISHFIANVVPVQLISTVSESQPLLSGRTIDSLISSSQQNDIERNNPFPLLRQRHITLEGKDLKKKIVIIGDVHGCVDELRLLLDKCKVDADSTVIFVGDLVNKGPYSAEVVSLARQMGAYSVRGNHDEALLKELHSKGKNSKKYDYINRLTQ